MANIDIGSLNEAISEELTIYSQELTSAIKEEARVHMQELVRQTKATAPVGDRRKHYRDHIKSKKTKDTDRGSEYVWYVEGSDYRLSHLLENGHATRDGGRTEGTHFIARASEPILRDFEEKVEEAIRNGR